MKAEQLKKRYHYLWKEVEQGLKKDFAFKAKGDIEIPKKQQDRIAHNAAFIATSFMDFTLKFL